MARFKVILEYDGSRYSGWQVQKDARTVQGELLTAARKLFNTSEVELYGSGRTDAGVHAMHQVAHLEVQTGMQTQVMLWRWNDELPQDINIISIDKASNRFHARYDAVARSYLYQISRRRTAFGKKYVWWIKDDLNVAKMEEATKIFLGMKDFKSFMDKRNPEMSTEVLMEDIQIKDAGDLILIRVVGSHFLWRMVRRIVGVLVEVGKGTLTIDAIQKFLDDTSNDPARYTAPASGLFLEHVYYLGDRRQKRIKPLLNF